MHHGDAVAERQHLVEVVGDQQHRGAGVARGDQLLLHVGDGADVEAPGRLVGDDEPRRRRARRRGASSARPRISFCMLPPESERAGASRPPPRTSKAARRCARMARAPRRAGPTSQRENARLRRRSETAFSHTGRSPITPTAWRSSGMRATPRCDQPRRRCAAARARRAAPCRASARAHAAQQLGQRRPGRCRRRRRSRRSRPRAACSDDVVAGGRARRRRCRRASSTQTASPTRRAAARTGASTAWPTIHCGELRLAWCRRRARRRPACRRAAPRCGRDTRSTSASLWLMKMIDRPLGDHLRQRGEQRLALLRRQHRGRLVEDQDARAAVQRLQDLDALALADRQLADPRVRVDRQAEALRHVAAAARAPRGGARTAATAARCRASRCRAR